MKRELSSLSGLLLLAALTACGDDGGGSCAGVNSSLGINYRDVCHNNWTETECKDWDSKAVSGQTWIYQTSSCSTRGFTQECSSNTWLYQHEDCY